MYLAALDPMSLVRALPGNVAQGIIWGIMALGVISPSAFWILRI